MRTVAVIVAVGVLTSVMFDVVRGRSPSLEAALIAAILCAVAAVVYLRVTGD